MYSPFAHPSQVLKREQKKNELLRAKERQMLEQQRKEEVQRAAIQQRKQREQEELDLVKAEEARQKARVLAKEQAKERVQALAKKQELELRQRRLPRAAAPPAQMGWPQHAPGPPAMQMWRQGMSPMHSPLVYPPPPPPALPRYPLYGGQSPTPYGGQSPMHPSPMHTNLPTPAMPLQYGLGATASSSMPSHSPAFRGAPQRIGNWDRRPPPPGPPPAPPAQVTGNVANKLEQGSGAVPPPPGLHT
jgi:hypothetical protein